LVLLLTTIFGRRTVGLDHSDYVRLGLNNRIVELLLSLVGIQFGFGDLVTIVEV
jgi:hypothetical protein